MLVVGLTVITGTPAEVGSYRIILRVIDQLGQTATVTLPLVVAPQGGQVLAWGFGGAGELGDGAKVSSSLPVPRISASRACRRRSSRLAYRGVSSPLLGQPD